MEKITTATPEAKTPSYTDEQVAKVMEAQEIDKMRAIHLIKRLGVEKALVPAIKTPKAAKPAKATKKEKPTVSKGDAKHYNQQAVIDGFLKHGKSIAELADAQKMSHVYAHRILTTKVPKEYAAEQRGRAEAREKAKATKGKPA
jgi:hypothetical protein